MKTANPYAFANSAAEKAAEADAFREYYTQAAFDHWTTHPYREYTLRELIRAIRIRNWQDKPLQILEPACGCGVNLSNLAGHFPMADYWGVDLSPEGIALAAKNLRRGYYSVNDAEDLPLADEKFDVVMCVAAAHHFHRGPQRVYFELVRVLKPGGLLFVFEPDTDVLMKNGQGEMVEEVKRQILALNGHKEDPAAKRKAVPRGAGEGKFDRAGMVDFLIHHGLRQVDHGHSEHVTEWARHYYKGWDLAVEADRQIWGGNKYWAIFERVGPC